MKTVIQRRADKKYLLSVDASTWTDKLEEAAKFSPAQLRTAYPKIVEIVKWTDFDEIKVN